MVFVTHLVERSNLTPGDHIYTYRKCFTYSHHGIYIGEGKVVHFTTTSSFSTFSSSSSFSRKSCPACAGLDYRERTMGVIVSCLDCFLKSGWLHRYEYGQSKEVFDLKRAGSCSTSEADPMEVVMARALHLLEENGFGDYNVLHKNCEDFATFCKTGQDCNRNGTADGYGQAAFVVSVCASAVAAAKRRFAAKMERLVSDA